LRVVLVGEVDARGLLDDDALLLALADRSPAGARHVREDRVLLGSQVDLERDRRRRLEAEALEVRHGEASVLELEMDAAEGPEGELD
jgi:hypothetical protein